MSSYLFRILLSRIIPQILLFFFINSSKEYFVECFCLDLTCVYSLLDRNNENSFRGDRGQSSLSPNSTQECMFLTDLGTVGVTLEQWVKEPLSRSLYGPVTLHSFPFCVLRREITTYALHLMSGEWRSTCVGVACRGGQLEFTYDFNYYNHRSSRFLALRLQEKYTERIRENYVFKCHCLS